MFDEFTRQNRIESFNSLKESIVNLKSAHEELEVTTQAFKESIAKEKELFERVLTMEVAQQVPVVASVPSRSGPSPNQVVYKTVKSVRAAPTETHLDEDDSIHIEGIMLTEKVSTVQSK